MQYFSKISASHYIASAHENNTHFKFKNFENNIRGTLQSQKFYLFHNDLNWDLPKFNGVNISQYTKFFKCS